MLICVYFCVLVVGLCVNMKTVFFLRQHENSCCTYGVLLQILQPFHDLVT